LTSCQQEIAGGGLLVRHVVTGINVITANVVRVTDRRYCTTTAQC